MTQIMEELQKIKGIGTVFAQRFIEAGYDTVAKIAAAGEDGLRNIRGLNAQLVQSILIQARELAGEVDKTRSERVKELKQRAASITNQMQDMALKVRKRFAKGAANKRGKKVKKEIEKIINSLEKAEGKLQTRVKRNRKVLVKAQKKLASLTETGVKGLERGLKKTRKLLENLPK